MQQVVFRIPLWFFSVPIYGYGLMLCMAFLFCSWLAGRRAEREGIRKEHVQDLAIWIFLFGILGARITYMIQYDEPLFSPRFFMIWEGGLVFYGSAIGGLVGYALAYYFVIGKHGLSTWKMADIIAPAAAAGLCLGRIGCLLNGCCYGNVACPDCPHIHFPLSAPARFAYVTAGYQTAAGFTLADDRTVGQVDSQSPAYESGLRAGDTITKVDDQEIHRSSDWSYLASSDPDHWPRGKKDLTLTVVHAGEKEAATLPTFKPLTVGLHPTQVYESISMFLLFLLLLAYDPFRRRDGEVMVLFMLCYPMHRFLNEMLRNDTDPVAFNMTLSQNGSIFFFVCGLVLAWWLWRKPIQYPLPHSMPVPTSAAS